jgi:YegS/Rv2252/BmrU family lipid kinase
MVAKVILNPYSNRWNSQARWPEAEAALKAAGLEFETAVSRHKGQVVALAEEAARAGFSPIIAAGGDGTIGETVNGLARAAHSDDALLGPLGVMPLGSANDLCVNLGLPIDLAAAAEVIAAGNTRLLDVGKLNERYFVNNSAVGLEPWVTIKHERITWIKGMFRYLVAAAWAILDKSDWNGELKWDDGEFSGPLSLVSVGNSPRTGGFYMTPHADPFDGELTFVYGYRDTRLGLFKLLPDAMKPAEGNYVEKDGVEERHTTTLNIHLEKPSPAHTDGELFSEFMQDFLYSIHPARLKILLP